MKLTWHDLLIESKNPEDWSEWLSPWSGVIHERAAPVFMNRFGSWFFHRASGEIGMFNVITGDMRVVAKSHDQFVHDVNQPLWQEEFLLSRSVEALHNAGKVLLDNQCYAVCPHPALGGINPANVDQLNPKFVLPMSVRIWQSICAQSLANRVSGNMAL